MIRCDPVYRLLLRPKGYSRYGRFKSVPYPFYLSGSRKDDFTSKMFDFLMSKLEKGSLIQTPVDEEDPFVSQSVKRTLSSDTCFLLFIRGERTFGCGVG